MSERMLIKTEEYWSTENEEGMFNGSRGSQRLCVAPDTAIVSHTNQYCSKEKSHDV